MGWQPSVLHNRRDGFGLAGCWSHFQPCPGGLAASGAQVHPRVHRKHGGCGGGRQDLRNYPGNRGWVRWKTRARVASPTRWCRPYRLLCSQAGRVGAAHSCAARGFAAIPAAAVGKLYGSVPARLHPRLLGNPRPPGAGAASRGGPPFLPPGRATPREPAGLHLGQHRFCRRPFMHLRANHRRAHNLHQALKQVRRANRGGRRAGPVRWPHVGCGCQHQRPSPPDASPPGRPCPRLHAAGDLHLRLRGGGAIPRQGRQYVGARPAVGNPLERGPRHRLVCGAASGKAVGELRKLSRPLLGAGRPFAGRYPRRMERQQQDRLDAGCAGSANKGQGRGRCSLAQSHRVGHGGLRPPPLSDRSRRDSRSRRWGCGICPAAVLHEGRPHNLVREHPAVRVAHRRLQLGGAVAANTHPRVALAHAEGPTNRGGAALLRTSGGACNAGGAASLHTIHKGPRVPPFGTGGGEQPHLAGWPDAALCEGGARAKRAAPARLREARAGHRASKEGAGKEAKAALGNRRRRPLHEEGCRPRRQGGLRAGIHGNGEWHKEGSPANGERVGQIRRSTEPLPPLLGVAHAGVGPYSRQPSRVFLRRWRSSARGPHCTGSPTPPPRTGQACAFAFCRPSLSGRPEGSRFTGTRSSSFPSLARRVLCLCGSSINQSINQSLFKHGKIQQELKIKNNLTILNKIQNLTTTNLTKTCFS